MSDNNVKFISPREFLESGALWWINRQLHLFGMAVYYIEHEDGKCELIPGMSEDLGFDRIYEENGFRKLRHFMHGAKDER